MSFGIYFAGGLCVADIYVLLIEDNQLVQYAVVEGVVRCGARS